MSRPPIIQYWDVDPPPPPIAELLATFPARNPRLQRLLFSETDAAALIAERFGARELAAFRACAVPAMQADYFRYCAVLALGGLYCDADARCVADLRPLIDGLDRGQLFGRPNAVFGEPYLVVPNGIFAFADRGHPLLRLAVDGATANIEQRIAHDVWMATGPAIFSSMYMLWQLGSFDAFLEYVRGEQIESTARLLCEVVGEYERIVEAFDGVRVSPIDDTMKWIGAPLAPLDYKQGELHWANFGSSIFR